MDYFNIRWPETISQKRSKGVGGPAGFWGEGACGEELRVQTGIDLPTGIARGGHRARLICRENKKYVYFFFFTVVEVKNFLWHKEPSLSLNQMSTSE